MSEIYLGIILALILVIIYLIVTRRQKVSLDQMKSLIQTSDEEMHEANKHMIISHKKNNELYKAILSIEQGRVKKND